MERNRQHGRKRRRTRPRGQQPASPTTGPPSRAASRALHPRCASRPALRVLRCRLRRVPLQCHGDRTASRPHSTGGPSTSQHPSTDSESPLTRPRELGHSRKVSMDSPTRSACALPETDVRKEDSRQKRERGGVPASQVGSRSSIPRAASQPAHLGLGHGSARSHCRPLLLTADTPQPPVPQCDPRKAGPRSASPSALTAITPK